MKKDYWVIASANPSINHRECSDERLIIRHVEALKIYGEVTVYKPGEEIPDESVTFTWRKLRHIVASFSDKQLDAPVAIGLQEELGGMENSSEIKCYDFFDESDDHPMLLAEPRDMTKLLEGRDKVFDMMKQAGLNPQIEVKIDVPKENS